MSAEVIRDHLLRGELTLARHAAVGALERATAAERPILLALLARACVRLGDPREGHRAAEQAAALSEDWEVRLALGEASVAIGDPVSGRAVLSQVHDQVRGRGDLAAVLVATALAHACRAAGDPQTGLAVADRAVRLAEERAGPASLQVADALHAEGSCLYAAGQTTEARAVLDRALDIRRGHAPENVEVAALLDTLGRVERAERRPFEAVARHREALAMWVQLLGPHASPVGACRHALAQALHRTGDFVAARDQMAHAMAVTARTLGSDHVDTWITRFELARYDVDVGRMTEGFTAMERARDEVRARLGREHPVVKAMDSFL